MKLLAQHYGCALVDLPQEFHGNPTYDEISRFLQTQICNNGYRVILKLNHTDGHGGPHFVFVVGKTGDDWTVFDPMARPGYADQDPGAETSLQKHLSGFHILHGLTDATFSYALGRAFVFQGPGSQPAASTGLTSASATGHCPIEVLVYDPLGRRLGNSGDGVTDLSEIPNAAYYRDLPLADDSGNGQSAGDLFGIKSAIMDSPVPGTYLLQVTGTSNGAYALDFEIDGPGGASKITTFSGTTDVGVVSNYSVVFPVIGTADLVVSQFASTNVVSVGSNLTYTIGIVNLGPSNAIAVTLVDTLPQYANFVAAGASQGTVTQAYGVVRCDIGDLPFGGAATVAVTITPTAARSLTNIDR